MTKIAVIVPQPFRGEYLRTAKDLALMLKLASAARSEDCEVVFGYVPGEIDPFNDLDELIDQGVSCRETSFKIFDRKSAKAIMHLARSERDLQHEQYLLPADGANDYFDCDAWLFVSDRVSLPVLPLRPFGFYVFDCHLRYVPEAATAGFAEFESGIVPNLRTADFVVATSRAVLDDVNSFAGVPRAKLHLLPLFFRTPDSSSQAAPPTRDDYLLWVTDTTPVGNHERVLRGLKLYYEELDGQLETILTGPSVEDFRPRQKAVSTFTNPEYAARVHKLIKQSPCLSDRLKIVGVMSEAPYAAAVKHARFLLHGGLGNTAPSSVIDAAHFGVPAACSHNPTTAQVNDELGLSLTFFDPYSIREIADAIKRLERDHARVSLPDPNTLSKFSPASAAPALHEIVMSQLEAVYAG